MLGFANARTNAVANEAPRPIKTTPPHRAVSNRGPRNANAVSRRTIPKGITTPPVITGTLIHSPTATWLATVARSRKLANAVHLDVFHLDFRLDAGQLLGLRFGAGSAWLLKCIYSVADLL